MVCLFNSYLRDAMRAAFVKNLLWLQLLNWLVKPLWILWIEREIQLRMGDAWYGVYTLHFNLVLLFAVLLDAGLNSYVSREIAAHGRLAHPKRMFFLRLGLGIVYVILILLVAQVQSGIQGQFLLYALLNQVLASVVLMLRSVLQGKQRFVSDSWLSVMDRISGVGNLHLDVARLYNRYVCQRRRSFDVPIGTILWLFNGVIGGTGVGVLGW